MGFDYALLKTEWRRLCAALDIRDRLRQTTVRTQAAFAAARTVADRETSGAAHAQAVADLEKSNHVIASARAAIDGTLCPIRQ